MTDWMMWLALAGVVVILEMFSGTFYLLMIAVGLASGALAAFAGVEPPVQLIIAAAVGVVATYALRRSKWGRRHKLDSARDPNVNLDIGQGVQVNAWTIGPNGQASARAPYRGALWDVELAPEGDAQPGFFIIREVRGSRLIVSNNHSSHQQ